MKKRIIALAALLVLFIVNNNVRAEEQLKSSAGQKEKSQSELKNASKEKAAADELDRLKGQALARKKQEELSLKQAQAKASQEESTRRQQERLKVITLENEEKQAQAKSRQEEKLKQEAERKTKEAQAKAKKQKEGEEKRIKSERERRAREEELAKQRVQKLQKEAERRQKRLEELTNENEERAAEFQIRQEEFAQRQVERLQELVWQREQREAELRARQEELARMKIERQIEEADLEAQREEQKQEQLLTLQDQLDMQRMEAREQIKEAKEASAQQKLIAQDKLKKQKEDQAKIEKIEKLWKEAKKLYNQEKYEEAIRLFQQIIDLEGNPRIKYTPEAKEYIEQAKKKIEEQKKREEKKKIEEEKQSALPGKIEFVEAEPIIIEAAGEKQKAESKLKKQKEDQAKIEEVKNLWNEAKEFYRKGKYIEAIRDFERVIDLEGDSGAKYSPKAKEYIEQARKKIEEKEEATLSSLARSSLKKAEISRRTRAKEPASLVESPPIRKKLNETKVTVDFDKTQLKSVMNYLSQESGVNFVASQKALESAPTVSIRLRDVTVNGAIKYITRNSGLIYRIGNEVVWVESPGEIINEPMETRIYYLDKKISACAKRSSESGSAQINKVFAFEDTLRELVPWPSDSKIYYDKRLNALLVRNTPQNLQLFEDIFYNTDM